MFLIVHASVGAAIGSAFTIPWLAAAASFFSHFIIDAIPHGDEAVGREYIKKSRHRWLIFIAAYDALASLFLIFWLWIYGLVPNAEAAFIGAVFAMLPDMLFGLSVVSGRPLFPALDNYHSRWHKLLGFEVSMAVGFVIQFIVLILVWLPTLFRFSGS